MQISRKSNCNFKTLCLCSCPHRSPNATKMLNTKTFIYRLYNARYLNLCFGKPLAIKLGRGSFFILKTTSPPFFLVNRICPPLNAKILWHSFFAVKKPVSSAPHKIRFAFFWTAGICLFSNEINIFNVTETIVSRETNAIAVRVPQRSERRQIEKTLGFWKRLGKSA